LWKWNNNQFKIEKNMKISRKTIKDSLRETKKEFGKDEFSVSCTYYKS